MDADSIVDEDENHVGLGTRDRCLHTPTYRREFHGIRQQVDQDLAKASRVTADSTWLGAQIHRQGDLLLPELQLYRSDAIAHDLLDVDVIVRLSDFPSRNARHV